MNNYLRFIWNKTCDAVIKKTILFFLLNSYLITWYVVFTAFIMILAMSSQPFGCKGKQNLTYPYSLSYT